MGWDLLFFNKQQNIKTFAYTDSKKKKKWKQPKQTEIGQIININFGRTLPLARGEETLAEATGKMGQHMAAIMSQTWADSVAEIWRTPTGVGCVARWPTLDLDPKK